MTKFRLLALALASISLVSTGNATNFADAVISYNSGAGFASGFTTASVTLGSPTATANPFSPAFRNTQLVSMGAGGSLTLQFNTPIQNDSSHPFGLDFTIFGNAGFVVTNGNFSGGGITDGSLLGNNTGQTRISVSRDNITYYQLNPSFAPIADSLFPTDGIGDFSLPINPALHQADFAGQGLTGIRSLYNGSAGGSSFDISWAQDDLGQYISLADISYIRIDVLSGKSEIDAISVVPEPSTWAITAIGAVILIYRSRRDRSLIS
ncbi:MAG: hypothetical protein JWQ71_3199 [Pedosphaera sp.]|nr:hypothetical protein [Pedosphaera sp.]